LTISSICVIIGTRNQKKVQNRSWGASRVKKDNQEQKTVRKKPVDCVKPGN
jgi:hypothetical protein